MSTQHTTDEMLATANALVTDPMTDAEVAFACGKWHGGQWTDMYGYQSSGELTNPAGIADEARDAYNNAGDESDVYELLALYQWACDRATENEPTAECEAEPRYLVIESTPGYLPDADEPAEFDDYADAVAYAHELADELAEQGYECDRGWASQDNLLAIHCERSGATVPDLGRTIQVVRDDAEVQS